MARYIDADALISVLEDMRERHRKNLFFVSANAYDGAVRIVKAIKTIEARPVVHGKWEEYQVPHIMCCSECDWGTEVQSDFKFCPNCGADMRGDGDG